MNNILIDLLQKQLSGDTLSNIGNLVNLSSGGGSNQITSNAVQLLLSALTKNASSQNGLSSLVGALDKDHDGSILDDLAGFLNGTNNFNNPRMVNGEGILGHLLGGNLSNVVEAFSQQNNLSPNQSSSLLSTLAPIILGSLTKSRKQNNLDSNGLFDLLKGASQEYQPKNQSNDLLSKMLDRDGDGNIMDDVANMGKNILGNLLKN